MATAENGPASRFCDHCGRQLPGNVRYCGYCGKSLGISFRTIASRRPLEDTPPLSAEIGWTASRAFTLLFAGGLTSWIAGAVLGFGVIAFIASRGGPSTTQPAAVERSNITRDAGEQPKGSAALPIDKTSDPKGQIPDDVRKTLRENYLNIMREEFRNAGVDASISDIHGELVVVSDILKLKPDRDHIVSQSFGPKVRQDLCAMGFKSLTVKSGVLLGDGDEYSLGCAANNEEREARLQNARAAKDKFVRGLQEAFRNDPKSPGTEVIERTNELVLILPSAQGLDPQTMREMFTAQLGNQVKSNLCSLGLRGLRVKTGLNSPGTLLSFGCSAR